MHHVRVVRLCSAVSSPSLQDITCFAGLALLQHKCRDGPDEYEGFATALMAPVAGNKCKKLFRFPWFVWVRPS